MSCLSTRDIQAALREQVVPAGATRHGLVIGIGHYEDAKLNLRCARADAEAVHRLMTDADCGLFPADNVRLLLDAEATRENIWLELASLCRKAGPDDTVWIYFAGHGALEGSRSFWVTHNADVDNLRGTALDQRHLVDFLDDIPAQRLLVLLDCCHAAATAARKNATRATIAAEQVLGAFKGKGRITLSSSDGREKSVELTDAGHGAFTYFLERGLRGEADLDGDGVVTADELWRFLEGKVKQASQAAGEPQTPVLIGELTHDFALSLNPIATAGKKKLAEAIAGLVGLGTERLSTEDAEFCLELLRVGTRTPVEHDLLAEFDSVVAGSVKMSTFRRLIEAARSQASPRPQAFSNVPARVNLGVLADASQVPARPVPALTRFTDANAVLVAQRAWADFLQCDTALSDASGIEFVLAPAGLVSLDLECGEGPEWIAIRKPFWISRLALEPRVLRPLFQSAAAHGLGRFAQAVGTTSFLKRTSDGFSVSAEDILGLCEFMSREYRAVHRLPSELEWIAAVSLFPEISSASLWKSCLGIEGHPGGVEWTGSAYGPLRSLPQSPLVVSSMRTALAMRTLGKNERRNAGSAKPMVVAGVRLVREINW